MSRDNSAKFKLGKDSLTYLQVKYPNKVPYKRYSMDARSKNNDKVGIDRLERVFLQGKAFEWATLHQVSTGEIIGYYHPTTNTKRLDKQEFYKQLGKATLKLYIIHTAAYKLKTGRTKGVSISIKELGEVEQYWSADIERIMVYQNGQHQFNYVKGQFFDV